MAITIDTHHHMLPGFFFEATNEKENPVGGLKPQAWTPEKSIAFMDDAGIDMAILSISTPGIQLPDRLADRELARKFTSGFFCKDLGYFSASSFYNGRCLK